MAAGEVSRGIRPVSVSAKIPAPPDEVLAFVMDTRNDPLWCANVETVEPDEVDRIEVGTAFTFHQHLDLPGSHRVQFDVETEVTQLTDDSVSWRTWDKFQERQITMTVAPDGDGTRITQTTNASFHKSPGLAGYAYPLLARRTFKRQFKALRKHFADQ